MEAPKHLETDEYKRLLETDEYKRFKKSAECQWWSGDFLQPLLAASLAACAKNCPTRCWHRVTPPSFHDHLGNLSLYVLVNNPPPFYQLLIDWRLRQWMRKVGASVKKPVEQWRLEFTGDLLDAVRDLNGSGAINALTYLNTMTPPERSSWITERLRTFLRKELPTKKLDPRRGENLGENDDGRRLSEEMEGAEEDAVNSWRGRRRGSVFALIAHAILSFEETLASGTRSMFRTVMVADAARPRKAEKSGHASPTEATALLLRFQNYVRSWESESGERVEFRFDLFKPTARMIQHLQDKFLPDTVGWRAFRLYDIEERTRDEVAQRIGRNWSNIAPRLKAVRDEYESQIPLAAEGMNLLLVDFAIADDKRPESPSVKHQRMKRDERG
jgi:hypothetical protein